MVKNKNNKNSRNSWVLGQWPQTKICLATKLWCLGRNRLPAIGRVGFKKSVSNLPPNLKFKAASMMQVSKSQMVKGIEGSTHTS